ncbi:MAG: MotA/TolQ/ExbB proton channel family protein [Candidatus Eisenbacteria bacterium]
MKLGSLLPKRGWVVLCAAMIAIAPTVVFGQSQEPADAGQSMEQAAEDAAGAMEEAAGDMQDAAGAAVDEAANAMNNAANKAAEAAPAATQQAAGSTSAFLEFFRKGGNFMWPLLLLSIVGLAAIIERFITLQKASTNTKKFIARIIDELRSNGIRSAIEVCQKTRGPIAAIVHSGLTKADQGPAAVEKAIEAAGGIEVAFLQRGLMVMATVANVAPLVGFLGTVSGMINAFEAIAAAEQVSAKLVASGISEALITTMAGLVVAIPVQIFHNYFLSRIDRFIIEMEESSIDLVNELEAGNIRP